MSKSANTFGQTSITNDHDYWELTNFGSNTINLANYKFQDDNHNARLIIPTNALPLYIGARESVVFVRDGDEDFFRGWWGPCVGTNVQIRCYPSPGFSSSGDSISILDPNGRLVDYLSFPRAKRGVSFVYDPITGAFPNVSKPGVGGACRAGTTDDVGSPGTNTGPIALRIVQQPASLVVCTQLDATFTVNAIGMPRPQYYSWYHSNSALVGKTEATLTINNVGSKDEGVYSVIVGNGITTVRSSNATLTIDTNLSPPKLVTPPIDTTVLENNLVAHFSVSVCANPAATYQWFSNGVAIPGGIGPKLFIPTPIVDMSGWEFSVHVQNSHGATNAAARLYVLPIPDLRITEVQANPVGTNLSKSAQCGQPVAVGPLTECVGHDDWFELTNFGTNAVNLLGYRFYDKPVLASAVSVTEPIVIQPNESVIFAKGFDTAAFVDWWGVDQLPPGLKVFAYGHMSLSSGGENLYLWSATAENDTELLYVPPTGFVTNLMGGSLWFDDDLAPLGADSEVGEFGAFRAAHCGDIGSPGYTTNPPPRLVSVEKGPHGAELKWRAVEGRTYQVEYSSMPRSANWSSLGNRLTATTSLPTMNDPGAANASQRFYRIQQIQQQPP